MGPSSSSSTMDRTRAREEEATSPVSRSPLKKRKTVEDDVNVYGVSSSHQEVGATELASAFALASLATLSPKSPTPTQRRHLYRQTTAPEARDVDSYCYGDDYYDAATATEVRSPKEDPIPVTPEVRSDSLRLNKKVTFSNDTKDIERQGVRRYSLPPRAAFREQVSHMPVGFRRPYFASRSHSYPPPPPPLPPLPSMHHHPYHHHWTQQQQQLRQPPRIMVSPGFMPPQQPNMIPPSSPHSPHNNNNNMEATQPNQWICDYCNVASFSTYQEACMHEETCSVRCNTIMSSPRRLTPIWHHPQVSPSHHPSISLRSPNNSQVASSVEIPRESPSPMVLFKPLPSASSREWFQGTTTLAIPDSDPDWLSELNCYVRNVCVEAFSATEEHIHRSSKRGRITLDQVGIRCRFCAHRPVEERSVAAVSFPASVAGIYESVKRWHRVHLEVCEDLPLEVHNMLGRLSTTNIWIPTTRQYWVDSARALGMMDTEDGIRFAVDPSNTISRNIRNSNSRRQQPDPASNGIEERQPPHSRDISGDETADHEQHLVSLPTGGGGALADGKSIVLTEDINLVPQYVYFLMSQVEACRFTEADRFVARSKGPVGYPGFQCRHCSGHAGLGKYFPVSSKSLSTNSTSQNIHAHLLKCRKCPPELRRKLVELKEEKSKAPRLEPGWRKVFFDKVWARMHGGSTNVDE